MTIDKDTIFQAVLDDDPGWQTLVNDNWTCLNPDDRRRILVLATGLGGGGGGAEPSWNDQEITTLLALAQGDPITATGLTATPVGRVDAYSPGGQRWRVGDGVKTKDIYFSGDAGVTARAHAAIVLGDIPYLGTTGAAAGGTAAGEAISINYSL